MEKKNTSFASQFVACFKRNLVITKRTKSKAVAEILLPVCFAMMSGWSYNIVKPVEYPAREKPIRLEFDLKTIPINWFVVPNSSHVQRIVESLRSSIRQMDLPLPNITLYESEQELDANAMKWPAESDLVGLVFKQLTATEVTYSIRMSSSRLDTKSLYNGLENCRGSMISCLPYAYGLSRFSATQRLVDSTLMQLNASQKEMLPSSSLFVYPKEKYEFIPKQAVNFVPFYLLVGFTTLTSNFVTALVVEKEKKIKTAMSIMGLRLSAYWLSWMAIYLIKVLIISCLTTIALVQFGVLVRSTVLLVVLLVLYGTSLIALSMLITPFFQSEKVAGAVATFTNMLLGMLYMVTAYIPEGVSAIVYWLICLSSMTAFTLGVDSVVINRGSPPPDQYRTLTTVIMLVADIALYIMLAFYFDHVIGNKDSQRHSLLFFLDPKFWNCCSADGTDERLVGPNVEENISSDVEEIEGNSSPSKAIRVENLSKTYETRNETVTALDSVTFNVYEGQITAVLGHNGAGKTTFIQSLTGIIKPNGGRILIHGKDGTKPNNLAACRSEFGVCLQEDILSDDLSPREHLKFFAEMKGLATSLVDDRIASLLKDTGLESVADNPCKGLSGGQKRKLCICIALVGDPKIVILDEPTSGVDPLSRRNIWTLLKQYRENHTLLITTHFMDEADILADRKIILSKGKVRCAGSSLFLKNRFGAGYHLNVNLVTDTDRATITDMVTSIVRDAKFEGLTGTDASFLLPNKSIGQFSTLFARIEQAIATDHPQYIKSYGVSQTTLEEVFLRLGVEDDILRGTSKRTHPELQATSSANATPMNINPSLWRSLTEFVKVRFLLVLTQPSAVAPLVTFPLIFLAASYFLLRNRSDTYQNEPAIVLNASLYPIKYQNLLLDAKINGSTFESVLRDLNVTPLVTQNFTNMSALRQTYMGATIERKSPSSKTWSWFVNDTFSHSLPVLQNLMTNAFYRVLGLNTTKITTINHPLPFASSRKAFDVNMYTFIVISPLFWCYIPSLLAIDVVEDRERKIRQALRMSGLSSIGYWCATFFTHFVIFGSICAIMLLIQRFVFQLELLMDAETCLAIVIMLLLYTPASFLCSYCLLHVFDKKDTARNFFPLFSYLFPFIFSIIVGVSSAIDFTFASTVHIISSFLCPFYVPQGILFMVFTTKDTVFDRSVVLSLCALVFHSILFTILLPFAELIKFRGIFDRIPAAVSLEPVDSGHREDDDVKAERRRVDNYITCSRNSVAVTPTLLYQDLGKVYAIGSTCTKSNRVKVAVREMNLFVEPEEVFGLLGPNGAGKTSAIKLTVADERPTKGRVLVGGRDVKTGFSGALSIVGYCPQHNALWDSLTLVQHLHAYAGFRGIERNQVKSVCDNIMQNLEICDFAHTKTSKLSGGTKRKLMYAIAVLSKPRLLLLDEPSTGLDPASKRRLWSTIAGSARDGNGGSVLLTTHSMEEATALCDRIGIMINGLLRCIGSVQHLKDKYGAGYYLELKWNPTTSSLDKIQPIVSQLFPDAQQSELYENHVVYNVPQESVTSIARVFDILQKHRSDSFEEFNFSQKTIEQVFLRLAKEQQDYTSL